MPSTRLRVPGEGDCLFSLHVEGEHVWLSSSAHEEFDTVRLVPQMVTDHAVAQYEELLGAVRKGKRGASMSPSPSPVSSPVRPPANT